LTAPLTATVTATTLSCPCGSGAAYDACCARWHAGAAASSAQDLMRSRYSAFVLGLTDYLLATWHPATRPSFLELDPAVKWLGLDVRSSRTEGDHATVEFVARSKLGGRATRLHEISRFVRESGRWYYVDGDVA
jgi:SEC-C motif-containing protein